MKNPNDTHWPKAIQERTTPRFRFLVQDHDKNPIAGSLLDSLELTLLDGSTKTVINERENVDILNVGGGSVDETGNGEFKCVEADTAITNEAQDDEVHIAQVTWTWDGGAEVGRHRIFHRVANLAKVPVPAP